MYLAIILIFASLAKCSEIKICDRCVCKYEKNNNKDFMDVTLDCSYLGDRVLSKYNELPNGVKTLDLSANNLTEITQSDLLKSDTIQVLRLNNNKISDININAFRLSELRTLDLSFNEIELLDPDIFRFTKKIEHLDLSSNKLVKFSQYTFRYLNNLNRIILDNNNIGKGLLEVNLFQSEGLRLNNGIQHISLKNISLMGYPDNFMTEAYDLRSLELNNNNISYLPELPFTLEYLDLSDNPIQRIDSEDFLELPALKVLKLNNLAIKEIVEFSFSSLHALEDLSLERNENLTQFSNLAFGREVLDDPDDFLLHSFSLRGSRVQTLSQELEVPLGQVTKLDLQGNPWICDCKIVWLKRMQIEAGDTEHLRCALPKSLYNARIFDLKEKVFKCYKVNRNFNMTSIVIAFVCLLLACTALWIYIFIPRNYSNYVNFGYTYTSLTFNNNGFEGRF